MNKYYVTFLKYKAITPKGQGNLYMKNIIETSRIKKSKTEDHNPEPESPKLSRIFWIGIGIFVLVTITNLFLLH